MAINISGSYGVNKEIRAASKIGWVTLKWLGSLAVCETPTIFWASKFPHSQAIQMFIYIILNLIFSFYMTTSPQTNPGKLMWEVILASLRVRNVKYKPLDYYVR